MMRLSKGAKETFGWVVVGNERELIIPEAAWIRYGFQAGDEVIFIPGSLTSGGFGLTTNALLESVKFSYSKDKILGWSIFLINRLVYIPESLTLNPGDRLLSVYGSRFALGFIQKGPIFNEATRHPELDDLPSNTPKPSE